MNKKQLVGYCKKDEELGARNYLCGHGYGGDGEMIQITKPGCWNKIYMYFLPGDHHIYFNNRKKDPCAPSFLFLLHERTTGKAIEGRYKILIVDPETKKETTIKYGKLSSFQKNLKNDALKQVASLNDIKSKIYFQKDIMVGPNCRVEIHIKTDQLMDMHISRVFLGHYVYLLDREYNPTKICSTCRAEFDGDVYNDCPVCVVPPKIDNTKHKEPNLDTACC